MALKRKKLLAIAGVVIVLIVSLIVVENSIKGINNALENKDQTLNLEEQKKLYENSKEYKEELKLTGIIYDFQKLLAEKNLGKIYDLIDEDYKDYKFQNNREKFDDYMSSYILDDAELSLQTYQKVNGRYVCRVLANNGEVYNSFIVLICPSDDETSYTLIFDNISSIKKKDLTITRDNLKINVLYAVSAENTLVYLVEYTNTGKKDIRYEYENVNLKDSNDNTFTTTSKQESITLKPGESTRQELVFYADNVHLYSKSFLSIAFKGISSEIVIDMNESGIEY